MSQLWPEKYFPKSAAEFIGNSEIVEQAFAWAKKWDSGERQPPLLLWGQTGSGKTCLAYLLAAGLGWQVVELNSSDLRSKAAIERIVGAASQNMAFFGSKRLILLDEVDALSREDRGGASAISSLIKDSCNPVILTATDIFSDKSVSALRFICRALEFKKINYLSIAKRLEEILSAEGSQAEEGAVKGLARGCGGDMRSALLDLQTLAMGSRVTNSGVSLVSSRERQQKVFSVMKAIFKGDSFAGARDARMESDLSSEMLFNWVEENIPRQYSDVGDIALAFDRLSRADIFNGRIYRRQNWGFLRYSTGLACEGVALSKRKPSYDFVMYQFPGLLSMLSRTSGLRALKKGLGLKIGGKTNSSARKVISSDLPFLKLVFRSRENAVALSASFGLDEKEIAFLLDAGPDTKKVQSVLEEAAAIREEGARPKFLAQVSPAPESPEKEESKADAHEGAGQTRLF
ncbi:MAG: replication factor C large subunit [Candidatus Diapherotrites archaeon]|uniref:Replication factor C large subunit n=1 Tax=Candidatus Iainarchaeum sp. TaxID=3101447 RepID=A0A8T3YJG4_9ARCH|nr:replication factor C large subunit [Candidatus Diapherotrites archaeon]